jgi:beta-glucanase (GH16 family)
VPRGKGTWAAIWMLPSAPFRYATTCQEGDEWQGSETGDAWPNSGEIDILQRFLVDYVRLYQRVTSDADDTSPGSPASPR